VRASAIISAPNEGAKTMWYGIGFGALFYFILAFTLGVMTLRKGHWVMFIFGIFLPIFWLIGALIPPTRAAEMA
jgi:hypothetical protein